MTHYVKILIFVIKIEQFGLRIRGSKGQRIRGSEDQRMEENIDLRNPEESIALFDNRMSEDNVVIFF